MDFLAKLDRGVRAGLPVVLGFFCVLLGLAPWPSPVIHALISPLPLMMLAYWVVHRPDLFPMAATFALGLLTDMLSGQFLGVTTLSYILADFILRGQRSFFLHQSFLYSWLVYALVLAGAIGLEWLLSCLTAHALIDFVPVMLRMAFSVLLFPVLSGVLQRLPSARG